MVQLGCQQTRSYFVPQTADDHKKVDTSEIFKEKIDGEADLFVNKPEPRSYIVCQTADGKKKVDTSEVKSFFDSLLNGKKK